MGLYETPRFRFAGDRGLLVEYGEGIDSVVNDRVRAMKQALERAELPGIKESVTAYATLTLIYDPAVTDPSRLKQELLRLEENLAAVAVSAPKVASIPVCYGGEYGPDLDYVARFHNLTKEEVISIHTEPVYRIYMLGFTPGFPYLGGLPQRIHTPRLATPRTRVPAGSVGIASGQTGIYSLDSPGGWQLIGRTPLSLFSPRKSEPILLKGYDHLKFYAISPREFQELSHREER